MADGFTTHCMVLGNDNCLSIYFIGTHFFVVAILELFDEHFIVIYFLRARHMKQKFIIITSQL